MLIQGLLLHDPDRPPEPGWLRVEGGLVSETRLGSPPSRPDLGGPRAIVCPGFVDAHVHLPQIEAVGCDGMPLLRWLDEVVFPAESWWGAGGAARDTRTAVRRMLEQGTTGFAGYLTSHAQGSSEAVRTLASGAGVPRLRAIAGRVAMDRAAPEALTQEDRWRAQQRPSPSPVIPEAPAGSRVEISANPRFAIACSDELLAEIGWLVKDRAAQGRPMCVQTHLAESRAECARVAELFPDDADYTSVYDRFALLTERTLLAHCVHLSDREWDLIGDRRSVVVHCPAANTFLRSGLFDLDAARQRGVRLALGSDVAGGPDVAMPRAARAMIEVAKHRAMTVAPDAHVPSPPEAWRLITRGNREALGWDGGTLEAGEPADLLVLRAPDAWFDEHLVGRLLYNWSSRLIESRVVGGVPADPGTI